MELPVPSPRVLARASLATVALVGAFPAAVSADGTEPSPAPRVVTAFPGRDVVRLTGYEPTRDVEVRVLRGAAKVPVARATGTTDAGGTLEINRSRGRCWDDATPDLIAGDTIVVAGTGAPAGGEATTVDHVEAFPPLLERDPATDEPTGRVIVRGTARNADGSAMDLADLEQRIASPALEHTEVGRRAVTATRDAGLSADPAVRGGFVAVHGPYEPAVAALLLDGETSVAGRPGARAGETRGQTVGEVGAVGGPAAGCPAVADYAVTASTPDAVTAAGPLRVSGIAHDAVSVEVTLSDGTTTATARARPAPATGAQTWSAELTAAGVAVLDDGTLTATATYTVEGGGRLRGHPLTIVKDLAAPAAKARESAPTPAIAEMLQAVAARNRLALGDRAAQAGGR